MDCIYPPDRERLQAIIEDRLEGGLTEHDIPNASGHWKRCPACREEFPNALQALKNIRESLVKEIRNEIERMRHVFLAEEHRHIAQDKKAGEKRTGDATLIALLAKLGGDIELELGFISEMGGDAPFNPLFVDWEDSESVAAWKNCAGFIRSLSSETQQFLFAAVMVSNLIPGYYFVRYNPSLKAKVQGKSWDDVQLENLRQFVSESGLNLGHCYITIKAAASELLRQYLDQNPAAPEPTVSSPTSSDEERYERIRLQATVEDLRREFQDSTDSLKATQDEIIRLYEANRQKAADWIPFLESKLGKSFYHMLDLNTQRALQLAEYLYRINPEPDFHAASALYFANAYHSEFLVRVMEPLVRHLIGEGHKTYDANGVSKKPLLVDGRINKLTMGERLWYVGSDKTVQNHLTGQGLNPNQIHRTGSWINSVRNPAAHGRAVDPEVAEKLRDQILTRESILRTLFPSPQL